MEGLTGLERTGEYHKYAASWRNVFGASRLPLCKRTFGPHAKKSRRPVRLMSASRAMRAVRAARAVVGAAADPTRQADGTAQHARALWTVNHFGRLGPRICCIGTLFSLCSAPLCWPDALSCSQRRHQRQSTECRLAGRSIMPPLPFLSKKTTNSWPRLYVERVKRLS